MAKLVFHLVIWAYTILLGYTIVSAAWFVLGAIMGR